MNRWTEHLGAALPASIMEVLCHFPFVLCTRSICLWCTVWGHSYSSSEGNLTRTRDIPTSPSRRGRSFGLFGTNTDTLPDLIWPPTFNVMKGSSGYQLRLTQLILLRDIRFQPRPFHREVLKPLVSRYICRRNVSLSLVTIVQWVESESLSCR